MDRHTQLQERIYISLVKETLLNEKGGLRNTLGALALTAATAFGGGAADAPRRPSDDTRALETFIVNDLPSSTDRNTMIRAINNGEIEQGLRMLVGSIEAERRESQGIIGYNDPDLTRAINNIIIKAKRDNDSGTLEAAENLYGVIHSNPNRYVNRGNSSRDRLVGSLPQVGPETKDLRDLGQISDSGQRPGETTHDLAFRNSRRHNL